MKRPPAPTDTGAMPALGPADEADLISRCRAGERAAHDEFYARFKRPVAANLMRVLGDRGELEDLVQDVFVIAFRGLATFRGDARVTTWLYRICLNVAFGRIRTRTRKPPPIGVDDIGAVAHQATHGERVATPEQLLAQKQARARVYAAMATLAPKKQLVLYLHEIEGRDLKEIAYLVGSNAVTVRTRLFYARREFYRALVADGEGGVPAGPGPFATDSDAEADAASETSS